MSGKITRKMIGLTVVCALLAGSMAGCGTAGKDSAGGHPTGNETGGPVSDNGPVGTPAAKTLRRETKTFTMDYDGALTVIITATEYLENGLGVRVDSGNGNYTETAEVSYDYDEHGAPSEMRMNYDEDTEAVVEITNNYENGQIISAQISDILFNGESALKDDVEPGSMSMSFYNYLTTLLRLMQHYEGYRNAEISIRNSETCIRLQNGEVVYSCYDFGDSMETTKITQDSSGHKTTRIRYDYDSESNIPAREEMTETDEYGRIVKYSDYIYAAEQQSMTVLIEYEIQANADAGQRTEVGHVTDYQGGLNTEDYSEDQLEAMIFTYTFADDVLVFSELNWGISVNTCEYSADGLLIRQTIEINTEVLSQSIVTEYEYR